MVFSSRWNILLTISILVSNRPDTVGKCLRSLDSLRRNVPSELILVDTGCGEQVRRMIEPYADQIVEFKWCNDFSKARNAGLKHARGEWFLYLDDDEWFEDTKDIEDFFLSEKHLYYNYGSYLVRNYFDLTGKKFRDEYVGRLIRLDSDTEFVHAIHETFSKVTGSRIRLHSYVHHYGYAFRNEEEARKHGQRNIELLLAEHEREPGELRHNAHLVQEYNALKEWERSIQISWEGIRNAEPGISTEQFLGGLYVNIVRNHINLEQYSDAARIGEAYLEFSGSNELDRAVVCYNLCIAYLEMKEYTESLKAAEWYLDFYEKWRKNRDATAFYEYLAIAFMSEGCRQAAICIAVQDGIRLGKTALAKKHFDKINWDIIHNIIETQGVQGMVRALVQEGLSVDSSAIQDYSMMIKVLMGDRMLAGMAAEEVYSSLRKEPASVLIWAKEVELWEMARKYHMDMGQVIVSIPLYRWERAVKTVIQEQEWQYVQEIQLYLQEVMDGDSFHMLYWSSLYRMRRIWNIAMEKKGEEKVGNPAKVSSECLVQEWLTYAAENEKLYRGLYREELFREMPELLPPECQVSLKLLDMRKAVVEEDFHRAVSDVKDVLEIMPELSDALKCCSGWIAQKTAELDLEQKCAGLEMQKLAEAVKIRVRSLAAQGMLTDAIGILHQMKELVPGDEEAEKLEQDISRRIKKV